MIEFFQDNGGGLSMSRLLCFLSFFPASYVVVFTADPDALGWYLGAFSVSYLGGKGFDTFAKTKEAQNVGVVAKPSTKN